MVCAEERARAHQCAGPGSARRPQKTLPHLSHKFKTRSVSLSVAGLGLAGRVGIGCTARMNVTRGRSGSLVDAF